MEVDSCKFFSQLVVYACGLLETRMCIPAVIL